MGRILGTRRVLCVAPVQVTAVGMKTRRVGVWASSSWLAGGSVGEGCSRSRRQRWHAGLCNVIYGETDGGGKQSRKTPGIDRSEMLHRIAAGFSVHCTATSIEADPPDILSLGGRANFKVMRRHGRPQVQVHNLVHPTRRNRQPRLGAADPPSAWQRVGAQMRGRGCKVPFSVLQCTHSMQHHRNHQTNRPGRHNGEAAVCIDVYSESGSRI
ncbi:hypothetical protein GGR57DRAFT_190417 [Xylariaceae sp. FL1272]|nr:hypothetical protein GGR57DRAFT_190417 [Xylariaceae sp. FL1272]